MLRARERNSVAFASALSQNARMPSPGDDWRAIHQLGHRAFIGGNDHFWDDVGQLQFEFLCERGLRPHHTFIDVACGSLRGGARFVRYLGADRYLGLDKHIELVIYGVALELGIEEFRTKRPRFVISDRFEFEKFEARADFGIAQSLFTHLTLLDIETCLTRLQAAAAPQCRFFATYFEADHEQGNLPASHSLECFFYTRQQLSEVAERSHWTVRSMSEWRHPRGQQIMELTPSL